MDSPLPIPHREPFLFLSRLDATDGEEALFSYDFPRHSDSFSGRMFPALLMVEAMAQAAAAFHGVQMNAGATGAGEETGVLASVDKVRVSARPRPGDRLTIKVRRKKAFGPMVLLEGEVWVSHRLACTAELVVRRGAPDPPGAPS